MRKQKNNIPKRLDQKSRPVPMAVIMALLFWLNDGAWSSGNSVVFMGTPYGNTLFWVDFLNRQRNKRSSSNILIKSRE